MPPLLRNALLAACPAAWLAGTAGAQIKFPVEPPTVEVGEVFTYRVLDLWNGAELRRPESEVVGVEADQLVVRFRRTAGEEPITAYFTRHWQPCRTLQGSERPVCAGALKFPLEIGGRHGYDKLPWPNGQGHSSATCQVTGQEQVSVPAGSFDTVRIECEGFWNRVFGVTFSGAASGRLRETYWYAPALSRVVRSDYVSYTAFGKLDTRERSELVERRKR